MKIDYLRIWERIILGVTILAASVSMVPALIGQESDDLLLHEEFHDLNNWTEFQFPGVPESRYTIRMIDGDSVLLAESDNSASALLLRQEFRVDSFPVLRWRWKVGNVLRAGDARRKTGDDYALRIYANFQYNPEQAPLWKQAKYEAIRLAIGRYPPRNALSFIWANQPHHARILPNQSDKSEQMVVMRAGSTSVGEWVEEEVNILRWYREAFGDRPSQLVSLAIMADSDDTGEKTEAYLDYLEVARKEETGIDYGEN